MRCNALFFPLAMCNVLPIVLTLALAVALAHVVIDWKSERQGSVLALVLAERQG